MMSRFCQHPNGYVLSLMLLAGAGGLSAAEHDANSGTNINVVVAIPPQAYIVHQLLGEGASVTTLLPIGQSPATFEPAPSQLTAVSNADVYFAASLPFEGRLLPRIERQFPKLKVVYPHAHDHRDTHGCSDPHHWLDPQNTKLQADTMARSLKVIAPSQSKMIETNLTTFEKELARLDESITQILDGQHGKSFYVYHPAYGHLADRFHLTQIAVEHEGKEPGTRRLTQLINQARNAKVEIIIVQPQFSDHAAKILADEIGAKTIALDPLAYDYPNNLLHIAKTIRNALVESP